MQETKIERKGDSIFILAGYAVIEEEKILVELRHALDSVAVEEIVEEHGVVPREVDMADSSHLVQRR